MTTLLKDADELGWPALSVDQSRQVDVRAIEEFGVSGMTLMENAGKACAARLLEEMDESKSLLVLAGGGNNGGDGFVIARYFRDAGVNSRVLLLVSADRLKGDAKTSYERAVAAGVAIETLVDVDRLRRLIRNHDGPMLDCLLGTGAKGQPREPFATAIRASNDTTQRRIAVDLPSGFDGDTGQGSEPTFHADLTLTFVTAKSGMRNPTAIQYLGEVEIVDIGLPAELDQQIKSGGMR